jgi:hypothetical protein
VVSRFEHVGRVSGMIDAADDGSPGDLADYRPTYRTCACGCGQSVRGRRYIDDAHRRAARNRRRRQPVVRQCACGCGETVRRGRGAVYVNDAHRERARKRRQRAGTTRKEG